MEGTSFVCKIYENDKLTQGRKEKIELMQTKQIPDALHICFPRAAVYDTSGTFRGFTMPRAEGKPLAHGLFHPSFTRTNPLWNRKHSTQLAITILEKIQFLHELNILIGDINPSNMLVKDEKNVYFVDCDSYQIGGFPCPVGMDTFIAPEIQSQNFNNILRTKQHELFAVATLLFMIFMPGKAPYGHEGGGGVKENIKRGLFPYAKGERHSVNVPKGPWRYCWSHLSKPIKEAFDRCFHAEHRGKPRVEIDEWLQLMRRYLRSLEWGGYVGPQIRAGFDLSIFPENLQRVVKTANDEVRPDGKMDVGDRFEPLPPRMGCRTDREYDTKKGSSPKSVGKNRFLRHIGTEMS
jgi:DNA-binding helix-hairpin-helix protein with protein kinase domain